MRNKVVIFWTILLLTGMALLTAGCQVFASPYEYKGAVMDPPLSLPDFELLGTDGQPFQLSDIEGDIALIYFGYTYCPDVCPLTMADVRAALAGLESGRERVHVIFISVDPDRDTPEVLERYMASFGPKFMGLTDDFARTQEVMKPFGAFAEKEETPNSAAEYLVSHTARLYLVTPDRKVLLTYPFGFESEELTSDLEYLLQKETF